MRMSATEYNTLMAQKAVKKTKFNNVKKECDGFKFDSLKELKYYQDLKIRERAGEIFDLELQPEFTLSINGIKICKYRADFKYFTAPPMQDRVEHIVDVKGMKTPVYQLKKKMMRAILGIIVEEV